MEVLFWLGALWLAYAYAGYPALLALVGLFARVRPSVGADYLPSVSVLIAARNEEKDIGWKLKETLGWDYPPEQLEILVASDASEDRTEAIVESIGSPRVRLVRMERRGGKVRALNRLAQMARGELLFFTDANASIDGRSLRLLVRWFADPRVGCVTGTTRPLRAATRGPLAGGAAAYFRYDGLISRLESRIGAGLACDGAICCVRRNLYRPLLPELANDLELPLRIRHAGYWTLFEPSAFAVEKETDSPREEFERRRRISAQGALAMWKLRETLRGLRAWQFVSHKALRWLTLIPLALMLVSSASLAAHPFFAALLAGQALFYASALGGWLLALGGRPAGRLFSIPFYALLGAAGALVGVADACLGRRFDVWEIPSLSRGSANVGCEKAGS